VTDTAPALGITDTATESTAFSVIVSAVVPVQNLPPPTTVAFAPSYGIAQAGTSVSTDDDSTPEPDTNRPDPRPVVAMMDVFALSSSSSLTGSAESRVSSSPPGQGSMFAQAETPLPSYAYGEKHPLPPVLPLDQTLPVAGFSESGGDSFALIDKLYRDAAGAAVSQAPPMTGEALAAVADLVEPIRVAVAPQVAAPADAGASETAPAPAEAPASEWRVWAAASTIVGSLVAWALLAHGSDGRLARAIGWLIRKLQGRPTQRTA
jgi:hypothetical protein